MRLEKGASNCLGVKIRNVRRIATDLAVIYRDVLVWSLKESTKSHELT